MPGKNEINSPVLQARDLVKRFGGLTAVDGVSFDVNADEILGVVGPNGAGKTALINLVSGFYPLSAGSILLEGRRIDGLSLHAIGRAGIARTFQNIRLLKRMTVLENVMAADQVHARKPLRSLLSFGRQRREMERAMYFLELMGLTSIVNHQAGALPYGQARRLEIARALATGPKVLLLDEPAAGMNEKETAELVEDVRRARTLVLGVILIEHDMSLISALADRLIGLNFGKIMAEGPVADVLADAEVRRAYLGEDSE